LSKDNEVKVIANHVPLLGQSEIEGLNRLSKGLTLNVASHQEAFVARIDASKLSMDADRILEYLVNVRDMPVGSVIPGIRLSCTTARSIHWGRVQLERYNERNGQSAETKVSTEMVGAVA
jgi:hypothetical protein